jgi:hypothetical protein
LLQHLLRAHTIFLLHHGPSLEDLYTRLSRQRFCGALERFWNQFIRDWDVLLHGNPAVDIYNGLKLAAGGELGIGVGEEDWGSGEREVLEDFIRRTDGVVDVVVSRFGDSPKEPNHSKDPEAPIQPWLASGAHPNSADGVIFSGMGAVTRTSVRSVSAWMEWLYKYGKAAYGVEDNPHSTRRRKRRKISMSETEPLSNNKQKHNHQEQSGSLVPKRGDRSTTNPGIPPSIVVGAKRSLKADSSSAASAQKTSSKSEELRKRGLWPGKDQRSTLGTETLMKYMTLGIYGSSWGVPAGRPPAPRHTSSDRPQESSADESPKQPKRAQLQQVEPKPVSYSSDKVKAAKLDYSIQGSFMIGLHGNLENDEDVDEEDNAAGIETDHEPVSESEAWNSRISVRTVYVERNRKTEGDSHGVRGPYYDRLRVVVYIVSW